MKEALPSDEWSRGIGSAKYIAIATMVVIMQSLHPEVLDDS